MSSANPDVEADAKHCELHIDDFQKESNGKYGVGGRSIIALLDTRPTDVVIGVGGYFRYYEVDSRQEVDPDTGESQEVIREGVGETIIMGHEFYGKYLVKFQTLDYVGYEQTRNEKTVWNFAYFVDLSTEEGTKRLWLKNGEWDFSAEDFSEENYYYSNGVSHGGYSSGRYLWRDSGSPLFDSYNQCH